jgi:hypothetical protein
MNYQSGSVVTTNTINFVVSNIDGYAVEYNINGTTGSVSNGTFSRSLSLVTGKNTFTVQLISQDKANCSPLTQTIDIYYNPPVVAICSGLSIT